MVDSPHCNRRVTMGAYLNAMTIANSNSPSVADG